MSEQEATKIVEAVESLPVDEQIIVYITLCKMTGNAGDDSAIPFLMRVFPGLKARYNELIYTACAACGESGSQLYWQN